MGLADRFPKRAPVAVKGAEARAEAMKDLVFGREFTDHMARAIYTDGVGWHSHELTGYGPLTLSPATNALHYAQEIFEGLKAYRHADGSVWAFRPQKNAERFQRSARRLAMAEMPVEDFLGSIEAVVQADHEWVPSEPDSSLYLRPFAFGSEPYLGVHPSSEITYLLIASPVGPYFATGYGPVSIWVTREYNRAAPGGTGAAKTGGNYAASLLPTNEAYANGCQQVCFLDAATDTLLEELGGMNMMLVLDDGSVATPRLTGTILEGVTRDSVLTLLREDGIAVAERDISIDELTDGIRSGRIREVFACGTAAVITPIGRLASKDFDITVGDGQPGPLTTELYNHLTDIQFGRAEDVHGWLYPLVP